MRESPLIVIWLDNLGLFYPLIGELGLTDFDRETGTLAPFEGAPKLVDFVGPALAKRLIPNLDRLETETGWRWSRDLVGERGGNTLGVHSLV
jgi:hypothetical protein